MTTGLFADSTEGCPFRKSTARTLSLFMTLADRTGDHCWHRVEHLQLTIKPKTFAVPIVDEVCHQQTIHVTAPSLPPTDEISYGEPFGGKVIARYF